MIDPTSIRAILALLVPSIEEHRNSRPHPFILALSGLQGSGKSTWAAALKSALSQYHGYNTHVLSIDDLYRDHDDLVALRNRHPENKLLRTRGQPGTHDEELARRFFLGLAGESDVKDVIPWPTYDKSLNGGQGGRVPEDKWERVPLDPPIDVLIFEGWCLGFEPLGDTEVSQKWNEALKRKCDAAGGSFATATLADHSLEDLLLINENLRRYCETFLNPARFNGFLHLDTDNLVNVYHWRIDQERQLRKRKPGMSDDEVVEFVRGYMPSYELFLRRLQTNSLFANSAVESRRKHIRVMLDDQRNVTSVAEL